MYVTCNLYNNIYWLNLQINFYSDNNTILILFTDQTFPPQVELESTPVTTGNNIIFLIIYMCVCVCIYLYFNCDY